MKTNYNKVVKAIMARKENGIWYLPTSMSAKQFTKWKKRNL